MAKKAKKTKTEVKTPTGPMLSKFLRMVAQDIEDTDQNLDPITKAEALARLVWKYALGWTEYDPDDPNKVVLVHKPDWRAVALLYDRIEGKVVAAIPDDKNLTLPEKVDELAKANLNAIAMSTQEDDD